MIKLVCAIIMLVCTIGVLISTIVTNIRLDKVYKERRELNGKLQELREKGEENER